MGIFSGNVGGEKLMLVFDIGSSAVGGAFFLADRLGTPKLLYAVREPIPLQENIDINQFLSGTLRSLEVVANNMFKAGIGAPENIYCVLSSPWHVSETRVIRMEKNTPFVFTSKLADSLVQKEVNLFEQYLEKYLNDKSPVRTIEFKNIKTLLNGYESPNPLNQKARELEMTIFFSISGEQVIRKMEDVISRYFHRQNSRFVSFTLASFAAIRDFFIHNGDFLLIDIDGEVTNISMSKKNLLSQSISFPVGSNYIVRAVANTLGVPLDEARSLINLLKEEHADHDAAKRVSGAVNPFRKEWLVKFQESLTNLSNDISIPSTIYLSVDKEEAEFFKTTIESEQFHQYTLAESKFKVIFLDAEVLGGMVEFGESVGRDPRLIIDTLYISHFLTN